MNKIKLIVSGIILLASNLVPLAGVIYFGWSLSSILFLYWVENIIMGIFNVLKMRRAVGALPSNLSINNRPAEQYSRRKLIYAFSTNYGIFTMMHGLFVIGLFGLPAISGFNAVTMAALLLLASHSLSYWVNYIQGNEYLKVSPAAQFNYPYSRVGVLHLTILLGAFAVAKSGNPIAVLVVMVILKTAIDLTTHTLAHLRAMGVQSSKSSKFYITFPEKRSEAFGFLIIIAILFTYFVSLQLLGYAKAPFA